MICKRLSEVGQNHSFISHYYTADQIFVRKKTGIKWQYLHIWWNFILVPLRLWMWRGLLFHVLPIKQKLHGISLERARSPAVRRHLRSSPGSNLINVTEMQMTLTPFHNLFNGAELNLWGEHRSTSPSFQLFPVLKPCLLSEEGNYLCKFLGFEFIEFGQEDAEFFFIILGILVC